MRVRSESACLVSVRACALRGGCAVAEVSCVSALALFRRADDAEKRKLNQAGTYRFIKIKNRDLRGKLQRRGRVPVQLPAYARYALSGATALLTSLVCMYRAPQHLEG